MWFLESVHKYKDAEENNQIFTEGNKKQKQMDSLTGTMLH